jgi:von Willebrand factor type A domain/Aerotolerance regulator N-terminal
MSFLNLGLGELIGLLGAISAGVVALYLLDRSKRRQLVATLRFWTAADVRTELKHRRRIQQPWSLLLQLVSLALLLLALAGVRWGGGEDAGRDHVVILDTSAWMGASSGARARGSNQQGMLMDEARASARAYIKALPSSDRVMLVRADALATPATAFESNRQTVEDAIRQSQAGASALNLEQAFQFAARAQKLQSQRAGEIVFVGAGRVEEPEAGFAALPSNVRVLPVAASLENLGIRKIGLRRSQASPDVWDIFVAVKNYGTRVHDIDLAIQFGGAPAGSQHMTIRPGAEEQASFSYKTKVAGYLEARIMYANGARDVFPQDDRAVIELPAQKPLRVVVYSADAQLLRPLFASNPQVDATFRPPSGYAPEEQTDVVVLDRFAPPARPKVNAIYLEPPAAGSPIPVRAGPAAMKLERWRADTAVGAGLHTKDTQLESAETFTTGPGDTIVAEAKLADATLGAVIVARPSATNSKLVVIGFQPLKTAMKYELATPLLIANILHWMSPETFRRWEVQAGTVGTVNVALDQGADSANVRVLTEDQRPLPFTIEGDAVAGKTLRFFAGAPGTARVLNGDRETVYSLTLPDVADSVWRPPQSVRHGIPRMSVREAAVTDLWPWLALLGGLGLLIDWLMFGRSRALRLRSAGIAAGSALRRSIWKKAS